MQLPSKSTWSLLIMRSCTLHRVHQRLITALQSKIGLSLERLIIDFGGLFSDLAVTRKVFMLLILSHLLRVTSTVLQLNLSKLRTPPLASTPLYRTFRLGTDVMVSMFSCRNQWLSVHPLSQHTSLKSEWLPQVPGTGG